MTRRRTVLIGTGAIAESHISAAQAEAERIDLVAAMDIQPERAAAFCQRHAIPRAYHDVTEMLRVEQPELVFIASPPAVHAEQCRAALEVGAWVWCEKPLCQSLAEFDTLTAVEARTGRYISTIYQRRFSSGARHLRQLLQAGALGQPRLALCQTTWYRDAAYYQVPWRGRWETETGGATVTLGIHMIDLLLYLMGDWREARSMMTRLDRDIEVENILCAILAFENGALASVVNSALSPREQTYLRLDCQRATVELNYLYDYRNADWRYTPLAGVSSDEAASWSAVSEEIPPSHAAQLRHVLDAYDRGEHPPASGADGRQALECVTALYKAAITGQPVLRGSIQPGDPFYDRLNGGMYT